ncbi:MAG: cupin domain-containing protein [Candidatus Hydrogenedentes bacterium]|nr:cupin domain-containing protein [Candidatus Hydrogenedentota bacterium]
MSESDAGPDQTVVAQEWLERGFSCDLASDPPDTVWEDFVHDMDELILVLEGEMELELPGETVHLESGQEFLVPGGVLHTLRTAGAIPVVWLSGLAREHAYTD